jgi:hypothetical protein
MAAIDRRSMLKGLGGAAIASVGLALMPNVAESMPLSIGTAGVVVKTEDDLVEKAQWRRAGWHRGGWGWHRAGWRRGGWAWRRGGWGHRRWVCRWRRGRRVCGWRW